MSCFRFIFYGTSHTLVNNNNTNNKHIDFSTYSSSLQPFIDNIINSVNLLTNNFIYKM